MNIPIIQPEYTHEYKEDAFAVKIAILYFIANGISAAMSTTLSSVSTTLMSVYKISESSILYLNSSYTLYYIFFNFSANYCIDKLGVRKSLIFGLSLTVIGAWLRTGIDSKISSLIFGQTIMAIAGPFIANCITKVSNQWFSQENRIKMTSLMSSSYMFGLGFGFLLTSISWEGETDDKTRITKVENLMNYSAFVCTVAALPVILYFREEPEHPPSKSAQSKRVEFMESLILLVKNRDYNYLTLVFSIGLGNFITMILMIHHVIAPFNFSEYQISNIGLIINFTSGISKCAVAFVAGSHISLKKTIITVFISISISSLLLMYSLSGGSIGIVYFSSLIFGFFCQMYWGPALEYANEIAFPVSESHATGNLLFGGCIMGIITNYSVSILYGENSNPSNFMLYLFFSYIACVATMFMISDRMKREEYEISPLRLSFNQLLNPIEKTPK